MSHNANSGQSIMRYVHPTDRRRPWLGVASLAGMLALTVVGGDFGTLAHLKSIDAAGSWLAMSVIEASASILALLLAAVALGERIGRGVEGPHFISLIRLTARGGFAATAPAVSFEVLKVAATSLVREGWSVSALVVAQIALLSAAVGASAFVLSSLWATLKLTFVGMPGSEPEEESEGEESGPAG